MTASPLPRGVLKTCPMALTVATPQLGDQLMICTEKLSNSGVPTPNKNPKIGTKRVWLQIPRSRTRVRVRKKQYIYKVSRETVLNLQNFRIFINKFENFDYSLGSSRIQLSDYLSPASVGAKAPKFGFRYGVPNRGILRRG